MCTDSTVGYSVANDAKKRYKPYCSQMRAWKPGRTLRAGDRTWK